VGLDGVVAAAIPARDIDLGRHHLKVMRVDAAAMRARDAALARLRVARVVDYQPGRDLAYEVLV
jgi:hypothetical protein